jgi:hypothetical protein
VDEGGRGGDIQPEGDEPDHQCVPTITSAALTRRVARAARGAPGPVQSI